ncbi:hypothetical protein SOVF_140230 isoform B [Spinacia oleracea]|nr:hypothetical protein SOVF_140230 isoform B [Spinacia oleracea]
MQEAGWKMGRSPHALKNDRVVYFFVMAEFHAQAAASAKPPKTPLKVRKQKLLSYLQECYGV